MAITTDELKELLFQSFQKAAKGIEPQHGIWTLEGFLSCSNPVGRYKMLNGDHALIFVQILNDKEKLEDIGEIF